MSYKIKVPLEIQKEIVNLYIEGFTMKEVSNKIGYNTFKIFFILKENGVKSRTLSDYAKKRKLLLFDKEDEVVERYYDGNSMKKLCKIFNVSETTIYRILKSNKVTMRSPGRRPGYS